MSIEKIACDVLVVGSGPGGATTACLRALGVRHDATEVTGGPYALAFPTPIAFHDDPAAARRSKSWGACRIGSIGQGDS